MTAIKKYRFLLIGIIVLILFLGAVVTAFSLHPQSESQWTVQTLKEYMDQRFDLMQVAVDKAEVFAKEKFENTNEWRTTFENLGRTYIPRAEYESAHIGIHTEVSELKERLDRIQNMKQGGNVVWAYVLAGASLIVAVFSIKDKIVKK